MIALTHLFPTSSTLFRGVVLATILLIQPSLSGGSVAAQVVQPTPGPEVEELNTALQRLARNPRNVDALVDAGDAALRIGDHDAAIGFYGRALDLSARNRRAMVGLGQAMLADGRPSEALALFESAERRGANLDRIAEDHGFALDLVGRHREAQSAYAIAMKDGQSSDLVRKLATSFAVTGDIEAFENTLRPLLDSGDRASFRTRAFGLAILGRMGEARGIITQLSRGNLAERTFPYLEMLTRMTGSEQVAAVNLGVFSTGSDTGSRLAVATPSAPLRADERLAPQRPELGSTTPSQAQPQRSEPAPEPQRIAVEDAFAEFADAKPADPGPPPVPPPSEPPEPVIEHPERVWVQVATGRDRKALGFDWRRFKRNAEGELDDATGYLADWGSTNRLLTGPFDSRGEANAFVNMLKTKGIDAFRYTSPEGQEISPLP